MPALIVILTDSGISCTALTCPAALPWENSLNKNVENVPQEFRIASETVTQSEREWKHPLSNWDLWKYPIHQMRGCIGHAAAATGRTDRTALAGKCHNPVLAAFIAMHPKKTFGQNSTIQEWSQFTFYETRDGSTALMLPGQEGLKVLRDYTIKKVILRIAGPIIVRSLTNDDAYVRARYNDRIRPKHFPKKKWPACNKA
jgi:hypothetical protein